MGGTEPEVRDSVLSVCCRCQYNLKMTELEKRDISSVYYSILVHITRFMYPDHLLLFIIYVNIIQRTL